MAAPPERMRQQTLDAFVLREDTVARVVNDAVSSDDLFVTLPWTEKNICVGNASRVKDAWDMIVVAALTEDSSQNTQDLRLLLQRLYFHDSFERVSSTFQFGALCHVVDNIMTPAERAAFFSLTLPWMKRIVMNGPVVFPRDVQALPQGRSRQLILSHEEAATLMTCGFFSLFPGRCYTPHSGGVAINKLPPFNFADLFCILPSTCAESHYAKIRCLLQYFMYCSQNTDVAKNSLEFYRVCSSSFPDFRNSSNLMQTVYMHADLRIEESYGNLQIDFANKTIGGGVLKTGCVQEEILFVTCPELLLARLLSEPLLDTEVLFMSGAGRYSVSDGYAGDFRFIRGQSPNVVTTSARLDVAPPREEYVRLVSTSLRDKNSGNPVFLRNSCVVAMDAVNYKGRVERQYTVSSITREIQKAFLAFKGVVDACMTSVHSGPVATGNWGCGAFRGDHELKVMIQWCAASEARRPLIYSTFNNNALCSRFGALYEKLQSERWTVGDVYTVLVAFCHHCRSAPTEFVSEGGKLFEYIYSTRKPHSVSTKFGFSQSGTMGEK